MDFDRELCKICEKYGITLRYWKESFQIYLEAFQEVWNNIPSDEPIAFYGLGKGYEHMDRIVDVGSKNVVCIIENRRDLSFQDRKIPIATTENMDAFKFNRIILTGFDSREQMRQEIQSYNSDIDIIDLYEILKNRGYVYNKPFFREGQSSYEDLETVRLRYKASQTKEKASKNLRLLIQEYLAARDFVSADYYIQEYICNQFEDSSALEGLRQDLQSMLADIRDAIKARDNKNVFVFILDSLSYRRAMENPFLIEFSKTGLSFTNAYSSALHTRASTLSYLTGKLLLEDEIFMTNTLNINDSGFLVEMQKRGCKVKHISSDYFSFIKQLKDSGTYTVTEEIMPLIYWCLLMNVVKESEECIYFIHCILETHLPYFSGNPSERLFDLNEYQKYLDSPFDTSEEKKGKMSKQIDEALEYTDSQMEFILGLLDMGKDTVIITSDHGESALVSMLKGIPHARIDAQKIPFIIHSKYVTPGIHEGLFSLIDIQNLLRQFINGNKVTVIPEIEYALSEMEPMYHITKTMAKHLARHVAKKEDWIYGRIYITTKSEQYIFYLNGKESFFILPDTGTNLINDKQYMERINYFRSKVRVNTCGIWRGMFKKYPYLLEVHKERAEELLNENKALFGKYV